MRHLIPIKFILWLHVNRYSKQKTVKRAEHWTLVIESGERWYAGLLIRYNLICYDSTSNPKWKNKGIAISSGRASQHFDKESKTKKKNVMQMTMKSSWIDEKKMKRLNQLTYCHRKVKKFWWQKSYSSTVNDRIHIQRKQKQNKENTESTRHQRRKTNIKEQRNRAYFNLWRNEENRNTNEMKEYEKLKKNEH